MPGKRKKHEIYNRVKILPALTGLLALILVLSAPAWADTGGASLWAQWPALAVGIVMGGSLGAIFFALRRFKGYGTAHEGGEAETFREIADFAGDWVWEMDADLRFTYLSARFFEKLPMALEMILGKTRDEFAKSGADDKAWQRHFGDLEARRPFQDFRYSLTDRDGRTRHIRVSGRPVFDGDGKFKGYQGTGTDLTQEVEAAAQAARAEATLTDAIESIAAGFALFDSDDRLVLCNKQYKDSNSVISKMAEPGVRFEDIIRKIADAGLYDEEISKDGDFIEKRLALHRNTPSDHEQRLADGRWLHIREYGTHDGGIVLLLTDITERKRAEEALEASEARFRNLVEGSVQGVLIHIDHNPLFVNQAYAEIFGYDSPEEVMEQGSALNHVAPQERDRMRAYSNARLRDEEVPVAYEFEGIRKDGTPIWLENRARGITWKGKPAVQRTIVDITERRRAEENLRQALEAAEIANRGKSEFLANMSHELRTPLNSVIGFSQVIRDEILGPMDHPKYQDYAADIFTSGQHLLGLISDILDVSKVEVGEMDIAEEPVDIGETINFCVRMIKERADRAEIKLSVKIAKGCPALLADERRLKQILLNLLSNAVKFTPIQGKVFIGAERVNGGGIRLWVADTGIGIAADDIPKVLKPFAQVESPFYRRHEGTGLGLSLAKSLSEIQGGSLKIESEVGKGTTVSIQFPPGKTIPAEKTRTA